MKKGWEIKRLGDSNLLEIIDGDRGKNYPSKKDFTDKGFCLFMNTKNVRPNGFEFDTKMFINEEKDKSMGKGKLIRNDVVMTTRGTIGNLGIYNDKIEYENIRINSGMLIFRPNLKKITSEYLFEILRSGIIKEQIIDNISGAAQPQLPIKTLVNFVFPVPTSLREQQRIVSILDKAFDEIEKVKRLTEENLKNAKELFDSYLQEVFENKGDDWEEKTLGDIAKVIGGYSFKSTEFKNQGKYQVLRMGNVRPGLIRREENPVFIDLIEDNILKKALLLEGDVIITQTGTNKKRDYGFTAIIDKDNYLLNQRIASIRFFKDYLPKYFLYYSWTNSFKNQYFANETGTVGQGNVGINAIINAIIPIPPLNKQQSIVTKIDKLSAETKKLEAIYEQKLDSLEELKKSILQKAFQGEL